MKGHFSYGFTITNERMQRQGDRCQKIKNEEYSKKIQYQYMMQKQQQQQSQDMLFVIGKKQIAQKRQKQQIDIEEYQQSDNDSDITVNLKQKQQKHIKKQKKQKKQKKHSKKQKKHKKKQSKQSYQQQQKKKRHKRQHYNDESNNIIGQKVKKLKQQQDTNNLLFPSLLLSSQPNMSSSQLALYNSTNPQSHYNHLYTTYLNKLQQTNLLPARTIKQMSSKIMSKNQQFLFLYNNDDQRFDKEIYQQFFTNGKFPEYLKSQLRFDVIRFPIKQLYTYGKHMNKDITSYKLISNFKKIIGVKQNKQNKYYKILRKIYQQLNQVDDNYFLNYNKYRDRGDNDRYFHYQGYQHIRGQNLVQRWEKLRLLRDMVNNNNFKINLNNQQQQQASQQYYISFTTTNFINNNPIQNQLSSIQSSLQQQFRLETRQITQQLLTTPKDIQLWLKLVNLQQQVPSLQSTSTIQTEQILRTRVFILQKQLAILSKALDANSYNLTLGKQYFHILFNRIQLQQQYKLLIQKQQYQQQKLYQQQQNILIKLTPFQTTQQLTQYILQFITHHPYTPTFWLLYLAFKLHIQPIIVSSQQFVFTHSYVKLIFKQINIKMSRMIEQQKSAANIKRLRGIMLMMLEKVLGYYYSQGYQQLALGIGIALLEFNLFVPQKVYKLYSKQMDLQKKKQQFKLYWQQYKQQRVGDLEWDDRTGWQIWENSRSKNQQKKQTVMQIDSKSEFYDKIKKHRHKSFIDFNINQQKNILANHILNSQLQQLTLTLQYWHPANPLYNKQRIKQSIQSIVLYEDIQQWLLNYRDSQNILRLINVVVQTGIGMMRVFDLQKEQCGDGNNNRLLSVFDRMYLSKCIQLSTCQQMNLTTNNTRIANVYLTNNNNKLSQQLFQSKYWPIQLTINIFCSKSSYSNKKNINAQQDNNNKNNKQYDLTFIKKLIYVSRLLRVLSIKIIPVLLSQKYYHRIYQLNEYRLVLLGVMYVMYEVKQLQDVMESKQNIWEEMKEIIGWYQQNRQVDNKNINQYDNQCEYDQLRLWAMYIHIQYMQKGSEQQQYGMLLKGVQCMECYQQIIVQVINNDKQQNFRSNKTDNSTLFYRKSIQQMLVVCRYYTLFMQQVLLDSLINDNSITVNDDYNYQVKQLISSVMSEHVMRVISCVWAGGQIVGSMQQYRKDVKKQVISEVNKLFVIIKQMFNNVHQLLISSSPSQQQNKSSLLLARLKQLIKSYKLINPIKKLQLNNTINIIYQDIYQSDTKQSINTNKSRQQLKLLQWLGSIGSGQRNSSDQAISISNKLNKHIHLVDVIKRRILKLNTEINNQRNKNNQQSNLKNNNNNLSHTIISYQLQQTAMLYKLWRGLLVRYFGEQNNEYLQQQQSFGVVGGLIKMIQLVVVDRVRELQYQCYNNNNSKQLIKYPNVNIYNDHNIIFTCSIARLYDRLIILLQQHLLINNTSNTNNKRHHHQHGQQVQLLVLLVIKVLQVKYHSQQQKYINNINNDNYKQQLIQLKSIVYPLIHRSRGQCLQMKTMYLYYLGLIDKIINLINKNNNNQTSNNGNTNNQLIKYKTQYQQVINQMHTHGIRLITLKHQSNHQQQSK